MPPSPAPPGFVTIGPGIYLSIARSNATTPQPNDSSPNVILIFGWMGALTRHLQTYSRKYAEFYPHAIQIIVKCEPSFFWTSERAQWNRLLPVVEVLDGLGCLPSVNNTTLDSTRLRPRVLVHSFSNSGGFQLASFSRLLSATYPSIPSGPQSLLSALVLDSSPAVGDFRSIGMAFSIAIQNPVARFVVLAFIYLVHALHLSLEKVFGMEMIGTRCLKVLPDHRVLPWMSSQTPRLYVFSKTDELVPWQGVQQHADAARMSGLNVRCEVYEDSAHVAHVRTDSKRYWTAIQDIWRVACGVQVKLVEGN